MRELTDRIITLADDSFWNALAQVFLPQGVVGVFCLKKPNQGEQWAPRICPEGPRATPLLSGIPAPKLWEIIKGTGALPKEDLKEQFPRSVLVPRNEWVLCCMALILTIKSQSKIVSHPFFSSWLCVCFLSLLPFPLFIQLLPSLVIITDIQMGGNGKKDILIHFTETQLSPQL